MNCREVASIMAVRAALPEEAAEHLRACPTCSALAAIEQRLQTPRVDPAVENRIVGTITEHMTPANGIGPAWQYAAAAIAVAFAVAFAGIVLLGFAGWQADSSLQKSYYVVSLAIGLLAATSLVAQLMTPGARLLTRPARITGAGIIAVTVGALLYPLDEYNGFARAVAACVTIGLAHAALSCALIFIVVRRGALLRRREMTSIIAFAGGLTGMVVLYVFCPHRDLGHFALGHTTVPIAATAIGMWLGRR